jgi:TPR repeat protein
MYFHGKGCEVDYDKSMKYYQEAAFQGHAGALFNLGTCKGRGREEDKGGRGELE